MTKIQKDIPIPPTYYEQNKYPFRQMEVGDCIFIEGNHQRAFFGGTLSKLKRAFGWEFVSRREPGGLRIWRTK